MIKATDTDEIGNFNLEELPSYQEFETHTPNLPDNGTSCMIEYKWNNVPYYLPEKSNESSLYEKWKKESEKINLLGKQNSRRKRTIHFSEHDDLSKNR